MTTLLERNKKFNLEPTHSFFDSKEHFQNFVNSWRQYIAEGKHECETGTDANGGTIKHPSDLTCASHLLYNVLRKQDLKKSFTPLTRQTKLENTKYVHPDYGKEVPYMAFYIAKNFILEVNKDRDGFFKDFWIKQKRKFLEPFGDTVTDDMLKEVCEVLKTINL